MKSRNLTTPCFIAAILFTIFSIVFAVVVLHDTYLAALLVGVAAALVYIFTVIRSKRKHASVLFCDLDGTLIITKSGKVFPEDCNDWQFRLTVLEAIRNYAPSTIHIISNQGGIDKGFVDPICFFNKMLRISNQLSADFGIPVSFDYCTSNDPDNPDRKPNPGMINRYLEDHHVSASQCLMIGDASGLPYQFSDSDLQCAWNAHIKYQDVDDFVREYNFLYHS